MDKERVTNGSTDERRAQLENLATDQVRAAVDADMRCGNVAGQCDIERSFVSVAAQHMNHAAERAARRSIELHGEDDRVAGCNGRVPKAGEQRVSGRQRATIEARDNQIAVASVLNRKSLRDGRA